MSSISQEDSTEGIDPRSSYDKYEHRKSHNYRDSYNQDSNSKYDEYSKFQNTGRSNSYDQSEGHPYQNGSPTHDESGEYMQEDSQINRENLRNTSGLEAVPERSVEHSEVTNKMSHMESDGQRWVYDEMEDNKLLKAVPDLSRGIKEQKYEQSSEILSEGQQSNEKSGVNNFISPRFQAESSEKQPRSKSRSLNERKSLGKDEHALRRPSQNNFNTLYNETFNRKAVDSKLFITSGRGEDSAQESPPNRNSSPSERGSPQKMHKYIPSRVTHKISPRGRQNLSALDFHVNERTSERYENGRLNKTDMVMPQSREDSFQGQDYSDLMRVIRYERERNDKLEEKVLNKDKLLKQMKEFHEKIYQNYLDKKEEFERTYKDKENLIKEVNKQNSQNVKLTEKVRELEGRLRAVTEELDKIAQGDSQKENIIRDLEQQLAHSNTQMDITNKKVESLTTKLNKKSQENKEIIYQRDKMAEKLDEYFHHKEHKEEDDEDEEKQIMKKNLDESIMQVRTLYKRNEELAREVELLKKHGHEKATRDRSDDSFIENKRKIDGRIDSGYQTAKGGDSVQQLQDELMQYKKKVAKLKVQNENLQLELDSRPTLRKFKENELKIQSLENDLEGVKHHHVQDARKSTTEVSFTSRILRDIVEELEIENVGEILNRIKDLQENGKANAKFVNSILELVSRCSPGGYFEKRPTTKQAWRWIKRLMEEYMSIKKDNKENDENMDQEILRETMDFLMVDDVSEISNKLRNVLVENNLMKRVVNKVKSIHNLEKVTSIQELERRLEGSPNTRGNVLEPRNKYHQMSGS